MTPLAENLFVPPEPWVADALCPQIDRGDLWFSDNQSETMEARRICMLCPSQEPCLDYALRNRENTGVWGATTARQRQQLRRGETVRFPARRQPQPTDYLDCAECGKAFQPEHGRQTCSPVCRQLRNSRMRSVSNSRRRRGLSLSEGETA